MFWFVKYWIHLKFRKFPFTDKLNFSKNIAYISEECIDFSRTKWNILNILKGFLCVKINSKVDIDFVVKNWGKIIFWKKSTLITGSGLWLFSPSQIRKIDILIKIKTLISLIENAENPFWEETNFTKIKRTKDNNAYLCEKLIQKSYWAAIIHSAVITKSS